MAKDLTLRVITPEGTFLETQAEYVDLPTEEGGYGVLVHHAETVLWLKTGLCSYVRNGEKKRFFIMDGAAHVTGNSVTITSNFAENEDTVEEALRRREEYYAEEKHRRKESYIAYKESRIELDKAIRNLTKKSDNVL